MKKTNRIISLFLSMLMILSAVPFSAYAEDGVITQDATGKNDICSWTYTAETKTLYIDGVNIVPLEGDEQSRLPAFDETVAEDGTVTRNWCTYDFENLVFSKNVETIDGVWLSADNIYPNITTVKFEDGSKLKSLGDQIFDCAYNLTEAELPYGLETIGEYCFHTTGLNKIEIPDTVYKIGMFAFADTFAESIKLPSYDGSETFEIAAGAFKDNSELTSLDLGTTIKKIPDNAFKSCVMNTPIDLVIPESVESIGNYAFSGCSGLSSIIFGKNVYSIGKYAFERCGLGGKLVLPESIREIGDYAFRINNYTEIQIPDKDISIGKYAFHKNQFTSVTFPAHLSAIDSGAFSCETLKSVKFETATVDGVEIGLTSLGDSAFENTKISSIEFPSTLEEISYHCFYNADYLTEIDLSNTKVADIGQYAFYDCGALKTVKLPDTLKVIGTGAFYFCGKLTTMPLPEGLERIESTAFRYCSSYDTDFPDSLYYVGNTAFERAGLTSVNFNTKREDVYIGPYAFDDCSKLTHVGLPENLTIINDSSFRSSGLLTVIIPKKVTTICQEAFRMCSKLTSVKFASQENLTAINGLAFDNCSSLQSLALPESLQKIGNSAFATGSKNIDFLIIPKNVTYVGSQAFSGQSLGRVYVLNPDLSIPSDMIYNYTAANVTIIGYSGSTAEKYAASKNFAFETLGDIPEQDFEGIFDTRGQWANGTWDITIKSGYICLNINGTGTLENDFWIDDEHHYTAEELIKHFGINGIDIGEGITCVPYEFFYFNKLQVSETAPGGYAKTYNNSQIKYLSLPTSLETIGARAFCGLNISSLTIPENVKVIGDWAFANTNLSLGLKISGDSKINSYAFAYTNINDLFFIDGSAQIGDYAFAYSTNLGKNKAAAINAKGAIGKYAFYGTSLAKGIILSEGITEIGESAFNGTLISSVKIPESVTSIGKKAFANCLNLISVTIPAETTSIYYDRNAAADSAIGFNDNGEMSNAKLMLYGVIGTAADEYANNLGFMFHADTQVAVDEEGYIYNEVTKTNNTWVYYSNSKTLYINGEKSTLHGTYFYYKDGEQVQKGDLDVERLIIGSGFTEVVGMLDTSIFEVFNPTYVTIPATVRRIGDKVFTNCTNLKSISIPSSVTTIEQNAFANCKSLQSVKFSTGVKTIAPGMFKNCSQLRFVDFGGVEVISEYAFQNCVNLQQIVIPDSVKTIRLKAFYKCASVQSVTLGRGLDTVGNYAFGYLPLCERITINSDFENLSTAGSVANKNIFYRSGISTTGMEVIFGNDATVANMASFSGENVTKITFSKNVSSYKGIVSLPKLKTISVSAENPDFYSYENCLYSSDNVLVLVPTKLQFVTIKNTTTAIGESAFAISTVQSITIPDSVTSIGTKAFYNCENLKKLYIPESVKSIGESAFENCYKLRILDIPTPVESIERKAFKNCINLSSVILPDSLKTIGIDAFNGCDALKGIVIPESVESIDVGAFAYCDSLEEIYVWDASVGYNLFLKTPNVNVYTMAGSNIYAYARANNIPYTAYTDRDVFYDICAMKLDIYAGYVGICADGHGEIQYLTVYEADCEHDGYIIGVCEFCSEILEEKHIDAYGHNYTLTAEVAPTASTKGVKAFTCTNCGKFYCEYTDPISSDYVAGTHNVSGSVVIAETKEAKYGRNSLAGVNVVIDGNTVATTDEDGNFSFDIETGTYEAVLQYAFGFDRRIYIVVEDSDVKYQNIPIIGCDFNKDGAVDDRDYELFRIVISASKDDPSYLSYVDMNNDGYINVKDMAIIKACMGIDSDSYIYEQITVKK